MIGFLHDSGDLFWHQIKEGRGDSAEFIAAVEEDVLPHLRRKTVLGLDKTPVHRSRLVSERRG